MPRAKVVEAALRERIAGLERELTVERQVRHVQDERSARCFGLLRQAESNFASTIETERLKRALAGIS